MHDTLRRNVPCWESFLDLSMYLLGESLQPFKVGYLPHQVVFIDILQLGRFKCTVTVRDGGNVKLHMESKSVRTPAARPTRPY